jgi:GNAT superfamily N-acetyltransferase
MKCHYGDRIAYHRCTRTGEYVCMEHARLDIVSVATRAVQLPLQVRHACSADHDQIREMALMYWEETDVDCFGRTYDLLQAPALVVECDGELAGVLSYWVEEDDDRLNVVMLNVHPQFQGRRAARSLLEELEREARSRKLSRLVVATSNDDLPALYVYQRCGFHITGIVPGAVLAHHGCEEVGFACIPVRDEIRLEKCLSA